jgi:NDP-sugar pyrophosphorylase family protein
MKTYRSLTPTEIETLINQNCSSDNWENIQVAENFDAKKVKRVIFTGQIRLGVFEKEYILDGNIRRNSGLFNATIHNCVIGDNVYIGKINSYLANYNIGDDTYIENLDLIAVTNKSTFGNGTPVSALNEGGGREVPACDHLSAHVAYMMSLYRHRPQMIGNLEKLIQAYKDSIASEMGNIGKNVSIRNCKIIKNVKIGDCATIEGCAELINGSINSNNDAPVYFGINVIAHDFIVSSGSEITEGALLDRCFVGQACQIGKQYSAIDSLFFCNCQGFHGEATAVFAGPFTVTHHKSSLLIAGMFSFLNAGSGSNQSNHMYKLGPIHQGIVERGSKTTSDSYILWPAKIGAFTLVMGRHTDHSDTSSLPFSYMIEEENETILVPAANLKSVGTIRDAQKWPKRDKRKDPEKLDQINFNLLSPYTIQKMMAGQEILRSLQAISGEACDIYYYHNTKIKNSSLRNGLNLYDMGIHKFLGNSLIKRLEKTNFKTIEEIRLRLRPDTPVGTGEWVDVAGLIAPKSAIDGIIDGIEQNKFESIEQLNACFADIHKNYYILEWTWAIQKIQERLNKTIEEITVDDVIDLVEKWKKSVILLDEILYEDAKKEFTLKVKTSFGVDGTDEEKQKDFENVRGDFDKNPFVLEVINHIKIKTELGNELIDRIRNI